MFELLSSIFKTFQQLCDMNQKPEHVVNAEKSSLVEGRRRAQASLTHRHAKKTKKRTRNSLVFATVGILLT